MTSENTSFRSFCFVEFMDLKKISSSSIRNSSSVEFKYILLIVHWTSLDSMELWTKYFAQRIRLLLTAYFYVINQWILIKWKGYVVEVKHEFCYLYKMKGQQLWNTMTVLTNAWQNVDGLSDLLWVEECREQVKPGNPCSTALYVIF